MARSFGRTRSTGFSGFALVDLLVATGVLLIALVGTAAALTSVSTLRRSSAETRMALTAARTALEQLRAAPFSTLLGTYGAGAGFDVDADGDGVADLPPPPGENPAGRVVVEPVAGMPPPMQSGILRAVATVRWTGVAGVRQVRLATMVSVGWPP